MFCSKRMEKWCRHFIDEFDKLYSASNSVRDECLETFRSVRNNRSAYAILTIVAIGTISIRCLTPSNWRLSPFNVAELLNNPYFTEQQVQYLFDEFAQNEQIRIDNSMVDDIFALSNGYGLRSLICHVWIEILLSRLASRFCLCGHSIMENLLREVDENGTLTLKPGQTLSLLLWNSR